MVLFRGSGVLPIRTLVRNSATETTLLLRGIRLGLDDIAEMRIW